MTGADRFEILEIHPGRFEMTGACVLEILEIDPVWFEMAGAGCNRTLKPLLVIST